jgi:L-asparaginase
MVRTAEGYAPKPGFLEEYLAAMVELQRVDLPQVDVEVLEPLLDSSDMQPEDWVRIARAVLRRYDAYDGFVVLHGTDTMAYTASALSFMLSGLTKPVIVTGAQLSLEDPRSDGREHIITSLILAGNSGIPEVAIYFGARLLRGNRAQKVHNNDFVAFDSGNLPPLARVGVRIAIDHKLVRPAGGGVPDTIEHVHRPEVASLRLFPGISPTLLEHVLAPPTEGLVLETYGAGNFPAANAELCAPLRDAVARGVVIINCSQCHGGAVRQSLYSTGAALQRLGVVSGRDMTPEAALTKLYWLLARGETHAGVVRAMEEDLAGELDPAVDPGAQHRV